MAQFSFIDLFAGIGGIRIPFDELGGRCVFTSEIDRHARETYAANFGTDANEIAGDIRSVPNEQIPKHDLLLGGFPCQPFSRAGHEKGFEDTRGTLFFEVERILKFHKPKALLLENVRGLVGHDKGHTFKRILEILSDDYEVHTQILNARDFGLPQSRARIYIVGIRKDLHASHRFDFGNVEKLRTTPPNVGAILEQNPDSTLTISDRLWMGHQARKARHLVNGNGWGYRLVDQSSPYTATLSARYYKDGSEILVAQENANPRKISTREAARLQGFPEHFLISKSKQQAYKQFGNAVPVNVVRAIAQTLEATRIFHRLEETTAK